MLRMFHTSQISSRHLPSNRDPRASQNRRVPRFQGMRVLYTVHAVSPYPPSKLTGYPSVAVLGKHIIIPRWEYASGPALQSA